jgi:hypothetical protein
MIPEGSNILFKALFDTFDLLISIFTIFLKKKHKIIKKESSNQDERSEYELRRGFIS